MPPLIPKEGEEEEYFSESDLSEDEWHPLVGHHRDILPEEVDLEEDLTQIERYQTIEDFIAQEIAEERNFIERAQLNSSESESEEEVLYEQSDRLQTEEQEEDEERNNQNRERVAQLREIGNEDRPRGNQQITGEQENIERDGARRRRAHRHRIIMLPPDESDSEEESELQEPEEKRIRLENEEEKENDAAI